MASRARIWNAVLVVLSAGNVATVWFVAQPGHAWHAAAHATLAVAFGLWAQGRMRVGGARARAGALDGAEIPALWDEVGEVRRELGEVQERIDFAERLLSQTREPGARPPGRRET